MQSRTGLLQVTLLDWDVLVNVGDIKVVKRRGRKRSRGRRGVEVIENWEKLSC
jgi:hypothetical protein